MRKQAQKLGATRALAMCTIFIGTAEYMQGKFPEALQHLAESRDLYTGIQAAAGMAIALQRMGVVATAMGKMEEARDYLEQGIAIAEKAMMRHHCLVRLYATLARNRLEAGDAAAALQAARRGLDVEAEHGSCITCNVMLYPIAAMACAMNGDLQAAVRYSEKAEASATAFGSPYFFGLTYQVQGMIAGMQHDMPKAIQKLREAKKKFQSIKVRYEVARSELFRASLLTHSPNTKNRRIARKLLQAALPEFEQMGAAGMASQARTALGHVPPPAGH